MTEASLWSDLTVFGIGMAISPLHIAVLLLLLLGPAPLRRGGLFLGAWVLTTLLTLIAGTLVAIFFLTLVRCANACQGFGCSKIFFVGILPVCTFVWRGWALAVAENTSD